VENVMQLGIDFGTCYSSAALLLDNIATPINAPLTPGYSFPSSIFITQHREILVGQAAENNRQKKPQSYRREFKRDLGSPDPYTLGDVLMLPEELITEVLKKLKLEAEKVSQARGIRSLTDVLITVPATYNAYKRGLMQKAGEKAGFSQVKILEEPVAAAIYYSQHSQINDGDIVLVYDLGGGTFDATLIQKQGDKYQILAMPVGLANCGGTDFDRSIYQHLISSCSPELRQQLEPKNAWLARAIVGDLCRDLKHQLSEQLEASIFIPMGLGQVETFDLTRSRFEQMISPLILETLDCCDRLLKSAGKDDRQINRMLLVGGSSRIPYVKAAIEQKFKLSPFLVDKPELAVCLGAAIGIVNNNISIPQSKTESQWDMSWKGHHILVKHWCNSIGNSCSDLSIDGTTVDGATANRDEKSTATFRDLVGEIYINGKVHYIRAHIESIKFGFARGCQISIDNKLVDGDINSK
jgi:molecular chaperone DnaK (HSP70)